MPLYENDKDRSLQDQVIDIVQEFLSDLPIFGTDLLGDSWFELKPTPTAEHHDFSVHHCGKFVAVGEIKCRNRETLFFEENGWMISRKRLTGFRSLKDKHVMLVLRASDGHVFYVMLTTLMANGKRLKPAPDNWSKTDHGEKQKDDPCLIIPFDLLKEIKQ